MYQTFFRNSSNFKRELKHLVEIITIKKTKKSEIRKMLFIEKNYSRM